MRSPCRRWRRTSARRRSGMPSSRRPTHRGAPPRSLDEPPLDRPAAELVAVGKLELAEHGADVRLDGLGRDAELERDLLVEVAAGDELEHLALARGELVQLRVDLGGREFPREGVKDEAGEARREDGVAIAHAH